MAIILDPGTAPAVALLANILFQAVRAPLLETHGHPWPFAPDSTDFSSCGPATLTVDGPTGLVTLRFAQRSVWPTLTGVLDPTLLEAQMSGPPNYINVANDGQSGRPGALSGASVSFGGA